MPGLKQLQKFNSDIISLGNEPTLRSERGEKPVTVPIPKTVQDIDDSDDFVLGMPQPAPDAVVEKKPAAEDEDFSDIMGTSSGTGDSRSQSAQPSVTVPDFSSLLNTETQSENVQEEVPDLSMFMEPVQPEEPEPEPEPKEVPISDLSLEDLLSGAGFDGSTGDDIEEDKPEEVVDEIPLFPPESNPLAPDAKTEPEPVSDNGFDLSVLDAPSSQEPVSEPEPEPLVSSNPIDDILNPSSSSSVTEDIPELLDEVEEAEPVEDLETLDTLEEAEDIPSFEDAPVVEETEVPEAPVAETPASDSTSDFSADAIFDAAESFDLPESTEDFSVPEELSTDNIEPVSEPVEETAESPATPENEFETVGLDGDFGEGEVKFDLDKIDNMNFDDLNLEDLGLGDSSSQSASPEEAEEISEPEQVSDDLFKTNDFTFPENESEDIPVVDSELPGVDDLDDDFKLPDENETGSFENLSSAEDLNADFEDSSISDGFTFDGAPLELGNEIESSGESLEALDNIEEIADFDEPESAEPVSDELEPSEVSSGTEFTDASGDFDLSPGGLFDASDLDVPDFEGAASDSGNELENLAQMEPEAPSQAPVTEDFNIEDFAGDFGMDAPDFGADSNSEQPLETFDTSEMEGMDFNIPDTDSQISGGGDFDLGESGDFDIDNGEFEIPGFSDVDTVQEGKDGKMKRPESEKSSKDEVIEKNALSDEQYQKFLRNLGTYPLNVRIAVEELLVKDEFTDDAEFGIIQKVIKKVSARQLAAELEKMLDITILVPRDFERRTAEEYEAYKSSFQYQLKNRIIPIGIVSAIAGALIYLISVFIIFCIYKPMKANSIYSEGYDLLCSSQYPQAEAKFFEAREIKLIKKWNYRYSEGFRERRQYGMARQWYKQTLFDFDHDKTAGMDYAKMELYDLEDYEEAERVLKREVLDYHINDPDAYLLLGDVYLEWATEKDPSKFEMADARYSDLIQLYGSKPVYLGRKLLYSIRTDNLEDVLTRKPYFMHKDDALDADGWTEFSGYLLDKLYGYLPPKREYLREKIEDVKEMLVKAVKADESNPTAIYNLSKYYVEIKSNDYATVTLKRALDAYEAKNVYRTKDIYNEIDTYRLLGEQYAKSELFLNSKETYTQGLLFYNTKHAEKGRKPEEHLELPDANGYEKYAQRHADVVGKLFADAGDLDYFIEGNLESALDFYQDSIDAGNDTPHVRYKVGYIQYSNKKYSEAQGSFMKAYELYPEDQNLLLALGNTFSLKNDIYASQGYYDSLMDYLNVQKNHKGITFPQVKPSDAAFVNMYLKASNNYGVSLYKAARRKGDSRLNGEALVQFQNSVRAWDALTRNQNSMVRMPGSNLAEQNILYATHPVSNFEPAIYPEINNTLSDEKGIGK